MSIDIPHDFSIAIQHLIAQGRYPNESAVVSEGLRLILVREKFQDDIQAGIDELDAGKRIEASEVYAEARRRIKTIESQPKN